MKSLFVNLSFVTVASSFKVPFEPRGNDRRISKRFNGQRGNTHLFFQGRNSPPSFTEQRNEDWALQSSTFLNYTEGSSLPSFELAVEESDTDNTPESSSLHEFSWTYWSPRVLLAAVACIYGTNFALGSVMNHALPASAATCARMVLASLALSPFVLQLEPELALPTIIGGSFTSMGYVTQSLALTDTSPATVSFLGAATVLVCPALQAIVDKKNMGWNEAPQTWISSALCILGVGVLELCAPDASVAGAATEGSLMCGINVGHVLALLQAVGFATGVFMSSKMISKRPRQALPVTSVMIATTAFFSMIWCLCDGWMQQPNFHDLTLPNVLLESSSIAGALLWTGLVSTSLNFFLENKALGQVNSSEASVILATEPMWAALFAAVMLGENLGWNDGIGGLLIVAACLANSLQPQDVHRALSFLRIASPRKATQDEAP